ncbi:integral membrane ATP-dependent zinc metallopeptidase [Campylobacter sp. RM5004]|uniref:AAA family ATPase n=1 Tax=Campylobacter sp. RM5004 TaxID=1660078 RepID=UPI001EFAF6B8|nr:AAA family ATPase [Campylobacter sp. RM5004]ULO01667.1 integral membrane ATP-dependent zinc metallopeptidase [Campylobacter sp. RM5004]
MTKQQPFTKKIKIIIVCIIAIIIALGVFSLTKKEQNISINEFSSLDLKNINNAYLYENMLYFSINNKDYKILANDEIIKKILNHTSIENKVEFDYSIILLLIMIGVFIYYLMYIRSLSTKQGSSSHPINNMLKPEFRFVIKTDSNFNDVIGQTKAKNELRKLSVLFKKNNSSFVKGVLLTGASGVGKTMLARALANECGVNFLYQSASSFNEIFVGLGAKRVRELFANAKKLAPCIVFIDEIDALGKQRGNALANDSENTLNELLTQIDGFSELKNVLIIAATNRADVLDNALLRRFDRKIHFTLPTYNDRLEFLKDLVAKDLISPDYNLDYLAFISRDFSGASFKSLENELRLKNKLSEDEIMLEILNIKHGISEDLHLNESERYIQAIYQAGKITMAKICDARLVYADLFHFEYFYPNENIKSFSEIKNEIKILLSGMLANEMFLGENYDNFAKDNEKIQKLSKFYMEFEIGILEEECKEFLKAYEIDIKQLADELTQKERIFFKDK